MVRTHGVRPWNQCLKSCFLIIWQLLAPFTSQPRVHKWVGSTTGWVLLWNRGSGADIWCPAMEPMSQIMFFNHLATFGTIYKLGTVIIYSAGLLQHSRKFQVFWNKMHIDSPFLNIKIILSPANGVPGRFLVIYSLTFNSLSLRKLTSQNTNKQSRPIYTLL